MAENNYDLEYTGSMVDRILDTGYDLQNQGYIFRGLASHYTGTPTERTWLIAPTGSTGFGLSSPVPPGSIGICMYNGSSWSAEVLNTLTLDSAPTTGSGNGITSGAVKTLAESITNAIGQLEQSVSDRFTSLELEDTTGSLQTELLSITLKYVFEGETETLTSLSILAATAEKAGLMSASDKQKLDAFVTNIRSLRIQDTTAQEDQGTEITNTLKWTIGGVTEAITAFTLYAATTSKAGLMSAADKTALDTLPSLINAGYLYAGIATPSSVPSSTSAKIFYLAIEGGTYTSFGNLNVTQGINIIYKSGNAWSVAQVVGIDDEPTAGSDNLVKSGGVADEIGKTALDVGTSDLKIVTELTDVRIRPERTITELPKALNANGSYMFTLTSASGLTEITLYLYKNGSPLKSYVAELNKPLIVNGYDPDSIAYYSETDGDLSIPIIVGIAMVNNTQEKVSVLGLLDNIVLDKAFPYTNIAEVYSRQQISLKKTNKTRIDVLSVNGTTGSVYVYLKDASLNTLFSKSVEIGSYVEIDFLSEDAAYVSWYLTGIETEGVFELVVSQTLNDNVRKINSISKYLKQLFYKEVVYNDGGATLSKTKEAISVSKDTAIKLSSSGATNELGAGIAIYLLNSNSEVVHRFDRVLNSEVEYIVEEDISYIGYYYEGSTVVNSGIICFSLFDITENEISDKFTTNLLYGPKETVNVQGNAAYLRKYIYEGPAQEGDSFYINVDAITGTYNAGNPIYVYFVNEDNVNVASVGLAYSCIVKAPANTVKVRVVLYPNQSSVPTEVDITYHNLYVSKGINGNIMFHGKFVTNPLPKNYYFEDNYLNNKVARINELMEDNYQHGDAFIFITDAHYLRYNTKQSPTIIQYIKDLTHVTKIIGGGDYEDQGANSYKNLFFAELTNNYRDKDINIVIGNHEYLALTNNGVISSIYHDLSKYEPNYEGDVEKWYYFYDDKFRKIRWIFLASYDESEAVKQHNPALSGSATNGYTAEQLEWLENVALESVPNGYDIVCVAHGQFGRVQSPTENSTIYWSGEQVIVDIFDAYKQSNPTRHILNIRGHVHCDRVMISDGGIPYVLTTCDKNTPWPSQAQREDPESPYYNWLVDIDVDRTTGTIREQAFDVMILNTNTHTLTAVRIGGKARDGVGSNDSGQEVEERTVNY